MQEETLQELERSWADGPYELERLLKGAVVSHRFPLPQQSKVRMIDDYTVSGANDTAAVHSKVDLHMVDTFCSLIKSLGDEGCALQLLAKTYDLKSAYRYVSRHACCCRSPGLCVVLFALVGACFVLLC